MAICLEMPASDLSTGYEPFDSITDLSTPENTEARPADLKPEQGEPKKKRTRKPKADDGIKLEAQPAVVDPDPAATAAKLAAAETSRSTRLLRIATLECDYIDTSLQINFLESAIEDAKANVKTLRERQSALAADIRDIRGGKDWQPFLPYPQNEQAETPPAASAVPDRPDALHQPAGVSSTTEADLSPAAAVPSTPPIKISHHPGVAYHWQAESIDVLGLPPKITEKLKDNLLSKVIDLQRMFVGENEVPNGIGRAKLAIIKDVVEKFIAGQQSAAMQVDSQPPVESQDTPPAADLTDAKIAAAVTARAATINDGSPSCLDRKHPAGDKYWQSGYEAYGRDVQLNECFYEPGIEADDWLRGWMAARSVDGMPDAVGPETPPPVQQPQQPPAEQVSLDDL
jgi:hypothetical protein